MVEPTVNPKAYGGVVVASPLANFGPGLERGTPYGTSVAAAAPLGGVVALSPTGGNDGDPIHPYSGNPAQPGFPR